MKLGNFKFLPDPQGLKIQQLWDGHEEAVIHTQVLSWSQLESLLPHLHAIHDDRPKKHVPAVEQVVSKVQEEVRDHSLWDKAKKPVKKLSKDSSDSEGRD